MLFSTPVSVRPVSVLSTEREPLIAVRDLAVSFRADHGLIRVVEGVSFTVGAGEILGLVGESGSGKTQTLLSLMGLIEDPNAVISGSVRFRGQEIVGSSKSILRRLRGAQIAMIFQDPMTALTPVHTVGAQIVEQMRAHRSLRAKAAKVRAVELLDAVGIAEPARVANRYPHQLSGGMRQRVVIAMALSCDPALLVADEPTTALDVTVQAQILALLGTLRTDFGSSIIIVTHDLGVVAEIADRVMVMYAGRLVETAPKGQIFKAPQHPYTWGLFDSIPSLTGPRTSRLPSIPGNPPSSSDKPPGCTFAPRCRHVMETCSQAPPPLVPFGEGAVACLLTEAERMARLEMRR